MALRAQADRGGADEESVDIVAEINITPLTDIFLVLLIIFMVTSSVMSQLGMDVQLPKASASATQQTEPEGVVVTLLSDGGIKVNETRVAGEDFAAFEERLKSAFTKTSSRLVILEGDRQAFLGQAISVMDHARRAGASQFAIATQPE